MDDAKKDEPQASPKADPSPGAAPSSAPVVNVNVQVGAAPPADQGPQGIDVRLVGLCLLLWAVAIGIFFSNWGDTKKDYYWGNIRQALEQPMGGYVDKESVAALVAQGEDVVPSCEHELKTAGTQGSDPMFKCAVLLVLKDIPGPKSRGVMAWAAQMDLDARVRANALLYLRDRAQKAADEKAALLEVARERVQNETELGARAIAGVIAAQGGDGSPQVKSLLVHALQIPPLRKDAWTCLKGVAPSVPPIDGKTDEELLKQLVAVEDWAVKPALQGGGEIAIIGSRIVIPPPRGAKAPQDVAAPASPSTTTTTSPPGSTAPAASPAPADKGK